MSHVSPEDRICRDKINNLFSYVFAVYETTTYFCVCYAKINKHNLYKIQEHYADKWIEGESDFGFIRTHFT